MHRWDIIGEQIVGDLAGTVSSTLNAAISSMLYDHIAKAELSTSPGLVGGFLRSDHRDDNISNLGSNSGRAGVSASQPLSPLPKSATDPGYIEIQRISAFLAILHVIVAGREEGGINWEMAKADETCMGGTTSVIKFVVTMLSAAKQRFTPLATSEGPSQILLEIFNVSLQVAKDLQAIVDKSSNVAANYPAKDSPEVEKWQTDFAGVYARANTLLATTQTMPGTAANGVSSSFTHHVASSQTSNMSRCLLCATQPTQRTRQPRSLPTHLRGKPYSKCQGTACLPPQRCSRRSSRITAEPPTCFLSIRIASLVSSRP